MFNLSYPSIDRVGFWASRAYNAFMAFFLLGLYAWALSDMHLLEIEYAFLINLLGITGLVALFGVFEKNHPHVVMLATFSNVVMLMIFPPFVGWKDWLLPYYTMTFGLVVMVTLGFCVREVLHLRAK